MSKFDQTDFNIDISLSENWNSNSIDPNCNTMMMSSGHYIDLNILKNSKLNTICPLDDDPYVDIYSLHTIYEDENKSNTNFDTCKYKSLEFCNNETNCNYELFSRSGGSDYMCIPSSITNFGSSGTPNCDTILSDPSNPGYDACACANYTDRSNCNQGEARPGVKCEYDDMTQTCGLRA